MSCRALPRDCVTDVRDLPISYQVIPQGAVGIWIRGGVTALSYDSQSWVFRIYTKLQVNTFINHHANREALVSIWASVLRILEDSEVDIKHSGVRGIGSDQFSVGFKLNSAGSTHLEVKTSERKKRKKNSRRQGNKGAKIRGKLRPMKLVTVGLFAFLNFVILSSISWVRTGTTSHFDACPRQVPLFWFDVASSFVSLMASCTVRKK